MNSSSILDLYLRGLSKLKEEILLYKNESDLWQTRGEVKNSAGNLALHLVGNLKHFIGAQLGNTGYVRDRDKEFSEKYIPCGKIITEIDETISVVNNVFSLLSVSDLQRDYPVLFLSKQHSIIEILFILYGHLNYHLGQINYQRRLLID